MFQPVFDGIGRELLVGAETVDFHQMSPGPIQGQLTGACLASRFGDDGGDIGLQIGSGPKCSGLHLFPRNGDFDCPVLVCASRRTMDSTSVRPEVGRVPDWGLLPFVDARHSDNKNDNTEDVCQRLRMSEGL